MGTNVSQRNEQMAWKLGCYIANFQVLEGSQDSILYNERDRIFKFFLPPIKQAEKRISKSTGSAEIALYLDEWDNKKVDHADSELGIGKRRTRDHVPRQNARLIKKTILYQG